MLTPQEKDFYDMAHAHKTTPTETVQQTQAQLDDAVLIEALRARPDFFLENPDVLENMQMPFEAALDNIQNVTRFDRFKASRLMNKLNHAQARNKLLIQTSIENHNSLGDVHNLVLEALMSADLSALRANIVNYVQRLEIDSAVLLTLGSKNTADTLSKRSLEKLWDGKDETAVTLRTLYEGGEKQLHGTDAKTMRSDALMVLRAPSGQAVGILVLGSKDLQRFHPGQGGELLTFLARFLGHRVDELQTRA